MHARTHAHTHARMHARTHARTYARTHARTHARMHTHTHTHTHTRSLDIVQDGVEAMGYGENRAVSKLSTNRLLDEVIRFHINGHSGFI